MPRKHTLALLVVALALCGAAVAGPLEDGQQALDRGDYAIAWALLKPLAEAGNADAQIELANLYFDGNGVRQDYAQSLKWYRAAADQGNKDAQISLGFLYKYGDAVRFDYVQSYKWFDLAGSDAERDIVATMMTPGQIAEAQGLAHSWTPKR